MEKTYAAALLRAHERGVADDVLVRGLIEHLTAVGRVKLLPGILRELKRSEARGRTLAPALELASADERAGAEEVLATLNIAPQEVRINPELITGWRARSGATLVDRSGKQSLMGIYRNIVTN